MEEEEDMSPPFWLQNSGANRRRLSRSYSLLVTSGTVVIILLVTTIAFALVVVPTLQSFTSHIFRPNSVKKSWDSLNILLVLFAIFCGFLSRNNNTNESPRSYEDQTFSDTNTRQEYEKPNLEPETEMPPFSWYEYSEDRTSYNRLRSFNSYPDLRQESLWVAGDERWRFNDDTHVNGYRGLDMNLKEANIKNINISFKGKKKEKSETIVKTKNNNAERKNKKTSATKELLTSLNGKKKKQRHKSVENFQIIQNSEPATTMLNSSRPSPPPPSSSFHNLLSLKQNKQKKLNSVSQLQHHVSSMPMSKTNDNEYFSVLEEKVVTGNESPLISIPPPPPPPPPFKIPAWKFKVQGDFVRIDSIGSSSSGSADMDDEAVESPTATSSGGEPAIDLLVYPIPNPDVDSKAGNFIECFRAGLRMEKINSMKTKENQGIGRSNLYNTLHQNHKQKKKLKALS